MARFVRTFRLPPGLAPEWAERLRTLLNEAVKRQQSLAERSRCVLVADEVIVESDQAMLAYEVDGPGPVEEIIGQPLSEEVAARWGATLAQAIETAYPRGQMPVATHGGLCAGCVYRSADGDVLLADFGVMEAYCRGTGALELWPEHVAPYLAPELWEAPDRPTFSRNCSPSGSFWASC